MGKMQPWVVVAVTALPLIGCSVETDQERDVAVAVAALSACGETAPEGRSIDGIPSYAQCDATQSSAIYSNNGVDTSTTQASAEWVRTQYSGGYQCTELAHRYLYFVMDVDWIPRGNAGTWCDAVPPASSGMVQAMQPVHGDLMVLAPGSCGASASTGHVNVVDVVDASGRLTVVEQNPARRGTYQQSCAKCFLHVVANTGDGTSPPPAAGAGAAGSGAAGAGAAGAAGSAVPQMPPVAGSAAEPPTTPPPPAMPPSSPDADPATTAPGTPVLPGAAGPLAPPLPPPDEYLGAAGTGVELPAVRPLRNASSESGCSVGGPVSGRTAAGNAVLLLLALVALRPRPRRRTRAR